MMSTSDFLLYGVISLVMGVFLFIYAWRRIRKDAWEDISLNYVIGSAGSGIALVLLGLFLICKGIAGFMK